MKQRNTESPEIIKPYFKEFKEPKTFHGVANGDLYNFNKIRFRYDYGIL